MLKLGTPAVDPDTGLAPAFPGKTIKIRGIELVLSAWNLETTIALCEARAVLIRARNAARKNDDDMLIDTPETIAAQIKLVAQTLRMNYPEVTEAMLTRELRLPDIVKLANAIAELNSRSDEDDDEGEAPAATETKAATTLTNGLNSD